MSDPITREEMALLRELIEQGFSGIHSRLDKVNGRLDRAETFATDTTGKLATLEERSGGSANKANGGLAAGLLALVASAITAYFGMTK